MGCITSKPSSAMGREQLPSAASTPAAIFHSASHVVSLVSTSYGILNLDCSADPPHPDDHPDVSRFDKSTQTETPARIVLKANVASSPSSVLRRHWRTVGKENQSPAGIGRNFSMTSSTPLFDPELIAFFERELAMEAGSGEAALREFPAKCPPGGEGMVVIYTTTLRGIRKTFEDCNVVRAAVEAYGVEVVERDVSMDSGFREELRALAGDVRVPAIFVKGRMIGGVEEVRRLEEEGRMAALLEGVRRRWGSTGCCGGCGGIRFIVCVKCSGSCRLVGDDGAALHCSECNENGLIHCPICC